MSPIQPLVPREVLQRYWGHASFRPQQEEIIQSVLAGRDTLALLPTGGGKSVCFQVPGLCLPGLTLVISPLIALMKDQVERLQRMEIPAAYINSAMHRKEVDRCLQEAMDGKLRFLYLAPERLRVDMFRMRLSQMPVSLLAIDEAHCISQWGYDFRPPYLDISQIREIKPQIPIIALTASATPQVQADILDKLRMRQPQVFARSFRRDNLWYGILEEENVIGRITDLLQRTKGSAIVYARTRRATEQVSKVLMQQGIAASAYHGGLPASDRATIQQRWLDNEVRVMVATNAFGMGIDKPDVRIVLHYHLPGDLESYYQEAGRAGRDGNRAFAVAFRSPGDIRELQRWSSMKYPDWEQLQRHWHFLGQHFQLSQETPPPEALPFRMPELTAASGESALALHASLRVLHNERFVELVEERDDFAYLRLAADPDAVHIYQSQHPALAPLLHFILRTLGGDVFVRARPFLPAVWAAWLQLTTEELHQRMLRLELHDMVYYTPARGEPSIKFLKPRRPITRQEVNWDKYLFLRETQARRLEALLTYVGADTGCRSLMIQRYFGEQDDRPCGVCDICRGQFRGEVSGDLFSQIQQAILRRLHQGPASYRELLQTLQTGSAAQRENVLQHLIDKQAILVNPKGDLMLAGG